MYTGAGVANYICHECGVSRLVSGILLEDIPLTLLQWVFRCSKQVKLFHSCLDWRRGHQWQWHPQWYSGSRAGDFLLKLLEISPEHIVLITTCYFTDEHLKNNPFFHMAQLGGFLLDKILLFAASGSSCSKSRSAFFAAQRALRLSSAAPSQRTLGELGVASAGEWWELLADGDATFATYSYLLYSFHLCEWRSWNSGLIWNWSSIPTNSTRCFAQKGVFSLTGWWFQTFVIFHFIYMGCHPSHWRTHIFQRGRSTTNQRG